MQQTRRSERVVRRRAGVPDPNPLTISGENFLFEVFSGGLPRDFLTASTQNAYDDAIRDLFVPSGTTSTPTPEIPPFVELPLEPTRFDLPL